MIALFMSICMIDQPTQCRRERLNFDADFATVQRRSLYGQLAMAAWAGDHQNWTIKRWRCGDATELAESF